MRRVKGLYLLDPIAFDLIYGPAERAALDAHIDWVAPPQTKASIAAEPGVLAEAEVIFSGWGMAAVDERFLASAPNLKAIFYGAGAIGTWWTDAAWQRGITVTTASAANAVPVAQYTAAVIVLAMKNAWPANGHADYHRKFITRNNVPGNFDRTIGLVSFGLIARQVALLLKAFQHRVQIYDPFVTETDAIMAGVRRVELDELFATSDAVSVHTPLLTETTGLVTGKLLASLGPGAVFVNTSRGPLVRQDELIAVATDRPDLQFILDVTDPEPLPTDSPLFELPNVKLTPHIAGSIGPECRRLGRAMVEELQRYLAGEPLRWAVNASAAQRSSHRQG